MAVTQIDAQGLMGWKRHHRGAVAWKRRTRVPEGRLPRPRCPRPPVDETVAPDGTPRKPLSPSLALLTTKFDLGSGKVEGGALEGASYKAGVSVKCSEVTVSADAEWSRWRCSAGSASSRTRTRPRAAS
jgi:hypothetical protein